MLVNKSQPTKAPLEDWEADALRFSGFYPVTGSASLDLLWADLGIGEPDSVTASPRSGLYKAEKAVERAKITLSGDLARMDLIISAHEETTAPSGAVTDPVAFSMDKFVNLLPRFNELSGRALVSGCLPSFKRIAFGCRGYLPTSDRVASYYKLSAYLPAVRIDPENSSDFLYRINRPRISIEAPELRINRLTTWSAVTLSVFAVQLISQQVQESSATHWCHVDLDVNTDAGRQTPLESHMLRSVFVEMLGLGRELLINGDVP